MASNRGVPPVFTSMWQYSRISAAIISITTAPWRSISPRSGCCSMGPCIRRRVWRSSMRMMRAPRNSLAFPAKPAAEVRTYGIGQGDWRVEIYTLTPAGAELELQTPAGSASVTSHLAGEVNIFNLLAALTAAHARGIPFDQLVAAVPELHPVPGRFQPVNAGQPFTVIVDYAHTDDALKI